MSRVALVSATTPRTAVPPCHRLAWRLQRTCARAALDARGARRAALACIPAARGVVAGRTGCPAPRPRVRMRLPHPCPWGDAGRARSVSRRFGCHRPLSPFAHSRTGACDSARRCARVVIGGTRQARRAAVQRAEVGVRVGRARCGEGGPRRANPNPLGTGAHISSRSTPSSSAGLGTPRTQAGITHAQGRPASQAGYRVPCPRQSRALPATHPRTHVDPPAPRCPYTGHAS